MSSLSLPCVFIDWNFQEIKLLKIQLWDISINFPYVFCSSYSLVKEDETCQSCSGIFQSPVYWESLGLVRGISPENILVVIAASVLCAFLLASLPFFLSCVACPLLICWKALSTVVMTALFLLSSFMPRTNNARAGIPECWLLLDLILSPCLLSCLLFLFALVSLFLDSLAECTGSHFYFSFPFVAVEEEALSFISTICIL